MSAIKTLQRDVLDPTFSQLLPAYDSNRARVMLLAIQRQEDHDMDRVQVLNGGGRGPARGLWQFERAGGVRGVLNHRTTRATARGVCEARRVQPADRAVWERLETDDLLACAFARLLLWTDPSPLPTPSDAKGALALYLRTWRPGAWSRGNESQRAKLESKWMRNHAQAVAAVGR